MSLPLVAIIGRPNVGKSSLFNRFLKKRIAIVDDTPGVTRDRNYSLCEWTGRQFYLIDTGGMMPDTRHEMESRVLRQVEAAISQADLAVLAVDCQTGIDSTDQRIAERLLKSDVKVLVLANKADSEPLEHECFQFARLGLGEPLPVSATVGRGIGEALDQIITLLPTVAAEEMPSDAIRIAVIGRPNVGKSSFINRLIGEERVIVSPTPGTTRDAVDTPFEYQGRQYILIDTAGLRRKAKVKEDVEFYTTLRTLRAIENCHVALVLVDAADGLSVQDLKIIEDAADARRGIVMAVNKWDMVEKDDRTADIFTEQIKQYARSLSYIPIIYVSALTGKRVIKTISLIDTVHDNWGRRIPTAELNSFLEEIVARQPPAAIRGKHIKLYYMTQASTKPPTFVFFCNYPKLLQKSYLRYLENRLREKYILEGVAFRIKVRQR
ncbi:MAG: ribosome biogenesis GTPase Der [Candidatus Zixiibacteriota bacterium]|nr:MAG: ribosome biogenesis GTPase Der [candidate division Zixibacteria bacterium]